MLLLLQRAERERERDVRDVRARDVSLINWIWIFALAVLIKR